MSKLIDLIKHPQKIFLFFWYKTFNTRRRFYQIIGSDKYSTVYPHHDTLMKYIGHIKNGFFVECGGNNGETQDPTYYLEKMRGWKGIIIEPLPIFKKCADTRTYSKVYNFALVSDDFKAETITLIDTNLMTTVKEREGSKTWSEEGGRVQKITPVEIVVRGTTLNKILGNTPQHIDLLVIDVEGYELEVLRGIDLKKYKPEYILIEILKENVSLRIPIENYLTDYIFVSSLGTPNSGDNLYQRKTQ